MAVVVECVMGAAAARTPAATTEYTASRPNRLVRLSARRSCTSSSAMLVFLTIFSKVRSNEVRWLIKTLSRLELFTGKPGLPTSFANDNA